MPRTLNRLPPRAATSISKPGIYSDGGGLYLRVTKAGSRQWVFIYQWPPRSRSAKRRELGLGGALKVSLARAREAAENARDLIAQRKDPIAEANAERALPTFGEMADQWIDQHEGSVRNSKSIDRWKRALGEGGYADALRARRVDEITTDDVLAVLRPIWHMGATATLARGYIEAVLDAATARRLRSGENPARWRGHLATILPKPQKLARGHHAALGYEALPAFMAALRGRRGLPARALEFTILTAVRSGEALGTTWGEIDLDAKLWSIPAERMKAGKPHIVPLSARAIAILEERRPEDAASSAPVFSESGRALSNMACPMLLRRMKVDATVHGFRSTFRDWAGDCTDFPRDLLETALAHSLGGVEAAYRRATALEKRRTLMDEWASYCGKVATLKPATDAESDRRAAS